MIGEGFRAKFQRGSQSMQALVSAADHVTCAQSTAVRVGGWECTGIAKLFIGCHSFTTQHRGFSYSLSDCKMWALVTAGIYMSGMTFF